MPIESRLPPLDITKTQAIRFLLRHQQIWPEGAHDSSTGIVRYIRKVGCIQFDPLDLVGPNPELVLQARFPSYTLGRLQELLYSQRSLLDGWDKNMSIFPVEDWPYFHRNRERARQSSWRNTAGMSAIVPEIREALRTRGPICSLDLGMKEVVDWAWAPTRLSRAALENMHFWGEAVIHHRVRSRKYYDLAERHLPAALLAAPDPNTDDETYHDWYVLRRLGSVGMLSPGVSDAWVGIHDIPAGARTAAIERLLAAGRVLPLAVQGIPRRFYMRAEDLPILDGARGGRPSPSRAVILAPLDNLLWDRRLIRELFNFDYKWEVYKPAHERRHGYYVLPILYGDRFIARFEPGRDPESGALIIRRWWWEAGVEPGAAVQRALRSCFRRFLKYLGSPVVRLDPKTRRTPGLDWAR